MLRPRRMKSRCSGCGETGHPSGGNRLQPSTRTEFLDLHLRYGLNVNQPIFSFDLPNIPASETVNAGTFSFKMASTAVNGAPLSLIWWYA
eukprot:scaffold2353_cov167-Amphora_coffeaeformis.AAC.76